MKRSFDAGATFGTSRLELDVAVEMPELIKQVTTFVDILAQYYGTPPTFKNTAEVSVALSRDGFEVNCWYDQMGSPFFAGTIGRADFPSVDAATRLTVETTWDADGGIRFRGGDDTKYLPAKTSTIPPAKLYTLEIGGAVTGNPPPVTLRVKGGCVSFR